MKNLIIDLDGTIADIEHRLHFVTGGSKKDWDNFFEACTDDLPKIKVIEFIKALCPQKNALLPLKIHIMSGRSESVRIKTVSWLALHIPLPYTLSMRRISDYRQDSIVNQEMAKQLNLDPSNTLCVIDDRKSVVDMWRSDGFLCLQVEDHDF